VVLHDWGMDFISRGVILDKSDLIRIFKKLPQLVNNNYLFDTDEKPMTFSDIENSTFEKFILWTERP
jgi:hypothetical protein